MALAELVLSKYEILKSEILIDKNKKIVLKQLNLPKRIVFLYLIFIHLTVL